MLNWNQVCTVLKIDVFTNLLIKNAEKLSIYMLTALLGSSMLYQFLKYPQKNISQPELPPLPEFLEENPPPDTPDSPQGLFKSR